MSPCGNEHTREGGLKPGREVVLRAAQTGIAKMGCEETCVAGVERALQRHHASQHPRRPGTWFTQHAWRHGRGVPAPTLPPSPALHAGSGSHRLPEGPPRAAPWRRSAPAPGPLQQAHCLQRRPAPGALPGQCQGPCCPIGSGWRGGRAAGRRQVGFAPACICPRQPASLACTLGSGVHAFLWQSSLHPERSCLLPVPVGASSILREQG